MSAHLLCSYGWGFSGVRLPKSQESRRLITYATLSMVILIIIPISIQFPRKAYSVVRYLIKGEDASAHIHWQVANALKQRREKILRAFSLQI